MSVVLATGAAAVIAPSSPHHPDQLVRRYEHARRMVASRLGHRAPGRDIARYGLPNGHAAPRRVIRRSLGVLERMLHPAPRTVSATPLSAPAPTPLSASAQAPGTGSLPSCASESGTNYSTGPANTNPSSGATGRYQIIPSTSAAYGCDLSTPAGQDQCAQRIYQGQGASAWIGCGG